MTEYKFPKTYKHDIKYISLVIIIPIVVSLLIFLFIKPVFNYIFIDNHILQILIAFLYLSWLLCITRRKIIIDEDKIVFIDLFSRKEFLFSDAKWYKITKIDNSTKNKTKIDKYYEIIHTDFSKSSIKMPLYFCKNKELTKILRTKLKDITSAEYQDEKDKILSKIWKTKEEQELFVKRIATIRKILNWWGFIFSLLLIFFPQKFVSLLIFPPDIALFINKIIIIITIAIPLLALTLIIYWRGLVSISISEFWRQWQEDVFPAVLVPSLALTIKDIYINIWNLDRLIIITIFLTITFSIIFFFVLYKIKFLKVKLFIFFLFYFSLYFSGSVRVVNFFAVNKPEEIAKELVSDKYIKIRWWRHRSKDYYFKVRNNMVYIEVTKDVYDIINIWEPIEVHMVSWLLDIKWFYVTPANQRMEKTELPPFR